SACGSTNGESSDPSGCSGPSAPTWPRLPRHREMQDDTDGNEIAKRTETETGTGTGTDEAPVLPPDEVRAVLEALIFASPQPLTPREIGKVLGGVPKEGWQAALAEIRADYARDGRG